MKILIYIQSTDNKINPISLETLVAAQKLKESKGASIHAVTFSKEDSEQLKNYDVDSIILVEDQNLNDYNPLYFIEALNQLMKSCNPNLIIFGHTYETRDWVPRLSARTNTPFISDCIGMDIESDIVFTRSLYQNKVNVDMKSESDSTIVSFQSGAYKLDSIKSGNASIDVNSVDLSDVEPKICNEEKFKESEGGVDLSSSDFIVSIGILSLG